MSEETKPTTEMDKLWQEYLQKCCEVGQIEYQLEQLESQKLQIEKELEKTQRQRNKAALDHREVQKKNLEKMQLNKKTDITPMEAGIQ